MKNKDEYEKVIYKLFFFSFEEKPHPAVTGMIWVTVILTSPLWVWGWVAFLFFSVTGNLLDGVREKKVMRSRADEHSKYY